MYLTIPVLMSRWFDGVEAERAVGPGRRRGPHEIEHELERIAAPYCGTTTLNVGRMMEPGATRTLPNHLARFDFLEPDVDFFETHRRMLAEVRVLCRIYPRGEDPGCEVIAAGDLPLEMGYSGIITPDGEYHEFWTNMPRDEADLGAKLRGDGERIERLIRTHRDCLAVVCTAHV